MSEHEEDTLQELKQTRFYMVFAAEASGRRETVREAIDDIQKFVGIEPNKYDEMLTDSDKYTRTPHREKYFDLLKVAKLLFEESVPPAAAATVTEPKHDRAVTELTTDDAVGGKRVRHDDATEPAKFDFAMASATGPTASSSETSPSVASTSHERKSYMHLVQAENLSSNPPSACLRDIDMHNSLVTEFPSLDTDSYSAAARQRSEADSSSPRPSTSEQEESSAAQRKVSEYMKAYAMAKQAVSSLVCMLKHNNKHHGPTYEATIAEGFTKLELLEATIKLLKCLDILLPEQRDDVQHKLLQTPYISRFLDQMGRHRKMVKDFVVQHLDGSLSVRPSEFDMIGEAWRFTSARRIEAYTILLNVTTPLFDM